MIRATITVKEQTDLIRALKIFEENKGRHPIQTHDPGLKITGKGGHGARPPARHQMEEDPNR